MYDGRERGGRLVREDVRLDEGRERVCVNRVGDERVAEGRGGHGEGDLAR